MASIGIDRLAAPTPFACCLVEVGDDLERSPADAVALDDALAERVGRGVSPPTLRIWENGRALVVPGWRLHADARASVVDRQGWEWPIIARGSGGTAVAHGPGMLNVSLILSLRGPSAPSIDEGYESWIALLGAALLDAYDIAIEAAPVEAAFCSGKYDAVVDGRKLAGVAQSRRNRSVVVHGTILVQVDRAEYLGVIEAGERLLGMPNGAGRYDPQRIVSLHELLGRPVAVDELASAIRRASALVPGGSS